MKNRAHKHGTENALDRTAVDFP